MTSPWFDARPPLVVSLVTTVDGHNRPNASPKVWWVPTSYEPPLLLLSLKPETDTAKNVQETGLFVLHVPDGDALGEVKKILHTAKRLPHGENELDDVGLKWDWLEHDKLERRLPYLPQYPWFCAWVTWLTMTGDHLLVCAQVGLAGGFPPAELYEGEGDYPADRFAWYSGGVADVLLHRGRNVFNAADGDSQFSVDPY